MAIEMDMAGHNIRSREVIPKGVFKDYHQGTKSRSDTKVFLGSPPEAPVRRSMFLNAKAGMRLWRRLPRVTANEVAHHDNGAMDLTIVILSD